jgi:hypothetical protein
MASSLPKTLHSPVLDEVREPVDGFRIVNIDRVLVFPRRGRLLLAARENDGGRHLFAF